MLGATLTALVAIAGCGSSPDAGPGHGAAASQPVRVAIPEQRCTIAPGGFKGYTLPAYGIGETLTMAGPNGTVLPWLAQSWRQTAPTTWEFQLRPSAQFQNGQHVTAAAVVAVLQAETKRPT